MGNHRQQARRLKREIEWRSGESLLNPMFNKDRTRATTLGASPCGFVRRCCLAANLDSGPLPEVLRRSTNR